MESYRQISSIEIEFPTFLLFSQIAAHLHRKEWTGCVRTLKKIDCSKKSPALVRMHEKIPPRLIQNKNDCKTKSKRHYELLNMQI